MSLPLCLLLLVGSGLCFRLDVLHTNDMHSRIEEISASTSSCRPPAPCYGGFARVAAVAAMLKDNNTIFLNAGDTFQGTPYYSIFKWEVIAGLIDKLGIDVMSLGNHEFDDGVEGLVPYLRAVKTPVVSANLNLTAAPEMSNNTNLHPSWNLYVAGVNISVIGYLTPATSYLAVPRPVRFFDEIQVLQKMSREAKAQGAKIVIALGHSGFKRDIEIAQNVTDVDLVVGGHTDTFLYTGIAPDSDVPESTYPHMVEQASGKKVPVVQAYGYTKYIGHLTLEFDEQFNLLSAVGNPVLLDSEKPEDLSIKKDIENWKAKMSDTLNEHLTDSLVELVGDCRSKECNLGNLITDAVVNYNAIKSRGTTPGWTDTPIAILNGGSIRTSLPLEENKARYVTMGDVLTVMPFENPINRVKLSGGTLKRVLEIGVKEYDPVAMRGVGHFLQVSGLKIVYDLSQPSGSRVSSVEVLCGSCKVPSYSSLVLNDTYNILVTEYMVQGGDGFEEFESLPGQDITPVHWNTLEALKYLLHTQEVIHPAVEGRIRLVKTEAFNSAAISSTAATFYLTILITVVYIFKFL